MTPEQIKQYLAKNKDETSIILSFKPIDDEGSKVVAEFLKTNSSLTYLGLYRNGIGNNGVKYISDALKVNTSLKDFILCYNEIGDKGAQYISDALKANFSLKELHLNGNNIGDDGAEFIAEALKFNSSLTNLNLIDNEIKAHLLNKIKAYVSENLNSPDTALARVVGNYLLHTIILKKEMPEELDDKFLSNYEKVDKNLLDQFLKENNSSSSSQSIIEKADILFNKMLQKESDEPLNLKYHPELEVCSEPLSISSDTQEQSLVGDLGDE